MELSELETQYRGIAGGMSIDNIERFPVLRITENVKHEVEDTVVTEFSLTIVLNNQELATLLCSPADPDYLAIGFLFSEGLLRNRDEINRITVDSSRGVVQVETKEDKETASKLPVKPLIYSGGGRGLHRYNATAQTVPATINSQTKISPGEAFNLMRKFIHRSEVFKITGGVHSAALCDRQRILVFSEDIGRHNTIDKVIGQCILEDTPTDDRIMVISGRVSSEMLFKVAKRNVPILITKAAPTNLGVKLADDSGVTLIGFVRDKRMSVYTNRWRVVTEAT